MTFYHSKASSWTEKHTKFAIRNKLGIVGQNLWKYLLSLGKEGTKVDYLLNHFQRFVERLRGKPHDFGYVKKKFNQLIFLGVISIVTTFENNCYSLIVHHPKTLELKNQVQKNSEDSRDILKTEASNNCNYKTPSNSSSIDTSKNTCDISSDIEIGIKSNEVAKSKKPIDLKELDRQFQIINLCARYGILFNPKKPTTRKLYEYPIEEIQESLELYKQKVKRRQIDNPQGWLLGCLEDRYYEDYNYSSDSFVAHMLEIFADAKGVANRL